MEIKLLNFLRALLIIVNVVNFITILRFVRLHIIFYPKMHDLIIHEVIVVISTIFFIVLTIIANRFLNNRGTGKSRTIRQ